VPLHLRPSATYAEDVLLPGDPGRALALAQQLLVEPRMSNHARGLWGYTGTTPAGRALSIQSTGIGGPSAAIVLHELAELGVRRAIRVGTCAALAEHLGHGDLVVVGEALAEDGASRTLGAGESMRPDSQLTARLASAVGAVSPARVVSTDLFYASDGDDGEPAAWGRQGAIAADLGTATLFTLGSRIGLATASVLAVSDTIERGERRRIGDEDLSAAVERMGTTSAAALAE
jgi:purine-nucleoside phosphorylase